MIAEYLSCLCESLSLICLSSKIESTNGSGCTTTGSSVGKGRPGQEMHHGIPYHVAGMWAEKDEKGARERVEERVGGLVILF